MPLDPIREALERAAQIVDQLKQNEAAQSSYKKLLLAAVIAAQALNRNVLADVQALLTDQPQFAVATPTPAVPTVKDMDAAIAANYDILRA